MSKTAWILWALVLMIPGAVGLGYHHAQKSEIYGRIEKAAQKTAENPATDEYLAMYDRWMNLTAEEKSENPWGQDLYGGPEIQKRLKETQPDRLLADIPDLDKGLKHYPEELAETLYGQSWRIELEKYRHQCDKAEAVLIASVFLTAGGGLIIMGGLGRIALSCSLGRLRRSKERQTAAEEFFQDPNQVQDIPDVPVPAELPDHEEITAETDVLPETPSDAEEEPDPEELQEEQPPAEKKRGYFESTRKSSPKTEADRADSETNNSFSELSASLQTTLSSHEKPKDPYFGWAVDTEEDTALDTLMTTEPLTKELTELTEEVSAIRQFAAQQQDQVRKLQDGYDWMIIRRFCMRIIRSIDNIDDRIARLDDPNCEVALCLEDIRDELVFALESSGIEQFDPDLKTPFKGLEKYVEAVRQRVATDDESLIGCIAEIVRHGYQYLISDNDVKIVRCAQVKLYDTN